MEGSAIARRKQRSTDLQRHTKLCTPKSALWEEVGTQVSSRGGISTQLERGARSSVRPALRRRYKIRWPSRGVFVRSSALARVEQRKRARNMGPTRVRP